MLAAVAALSSFLVRQTVWSQQLIEVSSLGVVCCLGSILKLTLHLDGEDATLAWGEAAKAMNLHIAQRSC